MMAKTCKESDTHTILLLFKNPCKQTDRQMKCKEGETDFALVRATEDDTSDRLGTRPLLSQLLGHTRTSEPVCSATGPKECLDSLRNGHLMANPPMNTLLKGNIQSSFREASGHQSQAHSFLQSILGSPHEEHRATSIPSPRYPGRVYFLVF